MAVAQMTSEQPPRDALRPLPSINIPLLREERSALRSRRLAVVLVATGVVAIGVLAALVIGMRMRVPAPAIRSEASEVASATAATPGVPRPPTPGAGTADAARNQPGTAHATEARPPDTATSGPGAAAAGSAPTASTDVAARGQRSEYAFGRAISFKHALENSAGLSTADANTVIDAMTGLLDFRRLQPTDTLAIERDAQGQLTRFEYRSGLTLHYEAVRLPGGKFKGKQIPVPIRVVQVTQGGLVQDSLGDALEGLTLGRSLSGLFTEVFEGKVNFATDTRGGDSFRIVLEEEYVGETLLRYGVVRALEYTGARCGTLQAFWHEPNGGDGDFYDANGRAMHGGWLRTPLRYDHISSGYGMRFHPVLKRKQLHNGVDYAAGSGTPVRAAASGTVTFAGPKGANGNLLVISHASGYETFYAHLLRFASGIKKGVTVKQRQPLAYVGSTGRSTGPHLHFSLKRHGHFVDPMSQLNGPGLTMPLGELPAYRRSVRALMSVLEGIPLRAPVKAAAPTRAAEPGDMGEEEL